ncbi:N-acetylmuramoyl-L-alanine amidase [Bacteroidota bacterium]
MNFRKYYKSFSTFLILGFLLSGNPLLADNTYTILFEDGKKTEINVSEIDKLEYLKLHDISSIFFKNCEYHKNKYTINIFNKELVFSPSSYYIAYINNDRKRVFQMREPAVYSRNEMFIPLNSLLISFEVLNIYKVDKKNQIIRIKEYEPYSKGQQILTNNNIKISRKPQTVEHKPNVYVLPPDLERSKPEKETNRQQPQQLANIDNQKPLALNSSSRNDGIPEIVKISAVQKNDYTEIHLYANSTIEEYHKPECDGKNLLIRIPFVRNAVRDYSFVEGVFPIISMKSEKIRHYLIYKIETEDNLHKCNSRRNGPKEIIFTVYPVHPKSPVKPIENVKIIETPEEPDTRVVNPSAINLNEEKKKWKLDVIVLDPGHGGKDAGAVGVTGVYEKNITLQLAKKVKELLAKELPKTKVILTRSDDRFIELYKRGQIANDAKGKLFISIHFNAARRKPSKASGLETFILRPGRNDDAIRVANFENSVIKFEKQTNKYKKLTDEELIIATMAQSAFVKFSELFARMMQEEVVKATKLEDRGVKQAGFYVLIGASMPNILFEACFLSNREDEKFANSEQGLEKIARGMVNAVKKYAEEYGKY